jgi:NADH-quinone oxidoreductase subunit H
MTAIYESLTEWMGARGIQPQAADIVAKFVVACLQAVLVLAFIAILVMFLIWWERKISARFQQRMGPMRTGMIRGFQFHGWAQSIADTIKLLAKEDVIPRAADRWVFTAAPVAVLVPAVMTYVVIPFGSNGIVKDLHVGLLYMIGVASLGVIGLIMAGWGSNNKWTLLGGMRAAAQVVSYEVPMVLSALVGVVLAGTLSMRGIVESQAGGFWNWHVFSIPGLIGFAMYFVCATAEVNRVPFDLPEAESELVMGFHTEYSGMKFALFFLAEYTNMFAVCAIAVTLFLGGWHGLGAGWLSYLAFLLKVNVLIFVLMWWRWTLPRLRVDQLMALAWKVLLPISLANVLLAGAWVMVVEMLARVPHH